MHIGIVAGEASGDQLGAALISAIKKIEPDAKFSGLGSMQMIARGFNSIADSEIISVMGLIEPIKRLPNIVKLRRQLFRHFVAIRPDVVIGIDSPDFNLGLAIKLKKAGLKTVHYISPSVWAWRKYRILKIKKAIDLMLTLLPFETAIYQRNNIPVAFVGHPVADAMPIEVDKLAARAKLGISESTTLIAILPGSREQEINFMCPDFIRTALIINNRQPDVEFIVPALDVAKQNQVQAIVSRVDQAAVLKIHYATGDAKIAMVASDCGMLTSGTVVLEAMFAKLPCIAAYRVGNITYLLLKLLVKVSFYTLPNLIANKLWVPEFIQYDIKPDAMAERIVKWLKQPRQMREIRDEFTRLHKQLRVNAADRAAKSILALLNGDGIVSSRG